MIYIYIYKSMNVNIFTYVKWINREFILIYKQFEIALDGAR